jgi:hypothetical protein
MLRLVFFDSLPAAVTNDLLVILIQYLPLLRTVSLVAEHFFRKMLKVSVNSTIVVLGVIQFSSRLYEKREL